MYPARSPGDQAGESRSATAGGSARKRVAGVTWLTMRNGGLAEIADR
jgi:hypothetical protein